MDGLKFTGESWVLPKVDDVVECTIKSINDDGAFVEIDSCRVKSWAQIPTRLSSLLPVSSVREAGLEVGMSLSAAVVEEGARSVVPGDKDAVQYILSLQSLQLDSAWDKAIKSFNGEADPFWTVTVLGMAPWGASVMSKEGLVGMIPARDLGNKAGDVGMVGAEVKVAIEQIRIEKKDTVNPQMVADYPIVFTFSRALKLELAKTYSEGDVADAKVIGLFAGSVDIEIDGVPFNLRKVDLSGYSKAWEIAEVFSMDETIKVYCILADGDNGDFRWSTRALEEVPGAIVLNKAKALALK
ncbi:30S ribosomal protein S1 [Durusdinium trenchii]|uniref:Chloroplastic (Plastid ribosomal protein S1) (PRPS1) n=1 Tax=Durusdinium trenchii TaxID=1381693 RepID=A0ABP0LXI7_9DINO